MAYQKINVVVSLITLGLIDMMSSVEQPLLLSIASAQATVEECPNTPAQTEGPYYLNLGLDRKDITEGKPGYPLTLNIMVLDKQTCQPLSGKRVEIWHTDAMGIYSGISSEGTSEETFLRGVQYSDEQGRVQFDTIYPGWYPGRAVHIHFKVETSSGAILTSQMYFNDSFSSQVFEREPYSFHKGTPTANEQDSIFNSVSKPPIVEINFSEERLTGDLVVGVE